MAHQQYERDPNANPNPAPDAQRATPTGDERGVPCRAEDCLFHDGVANCALEPQEIQIDAEAFCETYEPEEGATPEAPAPQGAPGMAAQPMGGPQPMPQRRRVPPA